MAAFAASRRAPVPLFDCAAYEFIRTRYNAEPQSLPSGQYNLGGTEFPFTPNTGHPFASFLLGSVSSAVFTQNMAAWLPRWSSHAWYVQTDYKPVRSLTLSLGVRWQYESPFRTKYWQQSQFDPEAIAGPTDLPRTGGSRHRSRPRR